MIFLSYILLALLPSCFFVSFLWSILISDRLYHCSDRIFFFTDFIPPFVHPENVISDRYLRGMDGAKLMALWCVFILLAIFISGIIFRIINKKDIIIKIIFIVIWISFVAAASIISFLPAIFGLQEIRFIPY